MATLVSLAIGALLAVAGCSAPGKDASSSSVSANASASSDANHVAAIVGGREVTVAEVDEYMMSAFLDQLRRLPPAELYEARAKGVQEMVQKQIIDAAAAERGVDPQVLFEQITSEVSEPSVEEVTAWYESNKERLRGAQLEDVASQIKALLLQEKQNAAWSAFMEPKMAATDLQVVLEAPRAEIQPTHLVRGKAEAPITIMAFSDYQCPYCVRSEPILAEVLARYPDQVRVIHRHFPLDSIHPLARPASEAAMCADEQGKFWEYHDAIFARAGKLTNDSLTEIGSEVGLDGEALSTCIAERRYADFVQNDLSAGQAAGVTGTPAFFVNGLLLKGSRDVDQFSQAIDAELDRISLN